MSSIVGKSKKCGTFSYFKSGAEYLEKIRSKYSKSYGFGG